MTLSLQCAEPSQGRAVAPLEARGRSAAIARNCQGGADPNTDLVLRSLRSRRLEGRSRLRRTYPLERPSRRDACGAAPQDEALGRVLGSYDRPENPAQTVEKAHFTPGFLRRADGQPPHGPRGSRRVSQRPSRRASPAAAPLREARGGIVTIARNGQAVGAHGRHRERSMAIERRPRQASGRSAQEAAVIEGGWGVWIAASLRSSRRRSPPPWELHTPGNSGTSH